MKGKFQLKQHGFSTVELLAVIAIIAILASIAIPKYQTHIDRAEITEAKSELQYLAKTMEDYYLMNNLTYSSNLNTVTGIVGTIKTNGGADYVLTAESCADGAGGSLSLSECVKLIATSPNGLNKLTIDSRGNKTFNGTTGWPE